MDMGDGSSFIDEINHSDLFGHEGDAASGFDWADDIISSLEGEERPLQSTQLENPVASTNQVLGSSNVQYGQSSSSVQFNQSSSLNVQFSSSTIQQAPVQTIQQPAQLIPNLTNLTQGGGQLIQGLNGQIFLKPLPNGQFQLSTQPQIQQIQHPHQSSSPIPIQPHPHGSPHVNQSPVSIGSSHVGSTSPHVSRSVTPLQQSRQFNTQNVNMLQVQGTGSQSQPQIIRSLPLNTQISNLSNFQTPVLQGHGQVGNQGQNYVNTQNTVIQNPNVVNVNVAHVLCPTQFQGQQQGQSIQGTLIQTADGKHIIIPSSQLASSNQIQIQNLPQMGIQPQINVVPSSSTSGTTPLVQGGQVVENNAATLGGLGYIRIATPSSQQDPNLQQQQTAATHFLGVNSQGQQIIIQRTPAPSQNIVLRPNMLQLSQQQNPQSSPILPQTSQSTQQILLPQVQRIMTGPQGHQQMKLVAPANVQGNNMPMTIKIGGQNVILPGNIQQLIQQPQLNQAQKTTQANDASQQNRPSSTGMLTSAASGRSTSSRSATPQPLNVTSQGNKLHSSLTSLSNNTNPQVPTFLMSVNSSTANSTPVTTTVSQTRQVISQVSISNSPKMYQTIPSVTSSITSTGSTQQKPFLSAVSNAPKLPTATIQLTPQAQQQFQTIQTEIRKLHSLKDPTDHQKKQMVQLQELQKQCISKGQIRLQPVQAQPQVQQVTSSQTSNMPIFIGQPALSLPQQVLSTHQPLSSSSFVGSSHSSGAVQSQNFVGQTAPSLVINENTSTCPTRSVQSQNGSIMSISPTGNKSSQQPIINQVQSTNMQSGSVVIQSQQGQVLVQGQQGSVMVQGQQSSMVIQNQQSSVIVQGQSDPLQTGVQSSVSPTPSGSSNPVVVTTPNKALPQALQGSGNQQVPVPTQIKIANHILTLNLTPEQRDKVQGYLSKMTPEQQQQQMALFLKLQHQQKLNAQVQAQVQQQKKLQTNRQPNLQSQIPIVVQQQSNIPISTSSSNIVTFEHPSTSPSKPNIVQRVSVAAIPKHQLIHQQLGKDQGNALHADTTTPFKNQRDTYRRLLRYHVFQTKSPPEDLIKKDDDMFDDLSEGLVRKKNWMFEKYRSLLLEESMREEQTAEIMMVQKLMNEDLKETIEEEKRTVKRSPEHFEIMPRKYLKLEPEHDTTPDVKFDPNSIKVKVEKGCRTPTLIKKESYDSDSSRPSTPKLKLVIKSDGQGYSSSLTEEDMEPNNPSELERNDSSDSLNFMGNIHIKEEQVDIDDNPNDARLDETLKPFESYSHNHEKKSYGLDSSHDSDDLNDNGADSNSDITVVSDGEESRTSKNAIVIDDDDDDDDENGDESVLGLHDQMESTSSRKLVEPVMKHEDISSDYTDYFSKQYQAGSPESSFFPHSSQSHLPNDHVISSFPSSDQISNDNASYSQNSDAHSTQTIPYSDDETSIKDEDLSNDANYNKSTSYAQYEPISSPEADHEDSLSNYLYEPSSSYNMGGIRDQSLNYSSSRSNRNSANDSENHSSNLWDDDITDDDNADKIKAEMESAINSILSLN